MFIDSDVPMAFRPSGGGMYESPDIQPALGLGIICCYRIYRHFAPSGA